MGRAYSVGYVHRTKTVQNRQGGAGDFDLIYM